MNVDRPGAAGWTGADMNILFQDTRFVVLDKPAGLKVHAGPGGGPSVEDFFPVLSRRRDGPWLAHRLDADTSGCLVIALRRAALHAAQAEFAAGRAEKTYWAIVAGRPPSDSGEIRAPLLRQTGKAGWRVIVDAAGKSAGTDYRVLGAAKDMAWLELRPHTGRTHQLRVHCATLGCAILGDSLYGSGTGLHLLARSLHLPLDPPLFATAPAPAHMHAALRQCGATDAAIFASCHHPQSRSAC